MLPPDDDNREDDDTAGFGAGPSEEEIQAVLAQMPADFYERLAPLLQLCAVAGFMLMGRADDPVPRAITDLTGFDVQTVRRLSNLNDTEGLGRLLLQEPVTFFDFILVGRLTCESNLFGELSRLLPGPENETRAEAKERTEGIRRYVHSLTGQLLDDLARYLVSGSDEQLESLRLRRLQLESIFVRLADTLAPMVPASIAPATGPTEADGTDYSYPDEEIVLEIGFHEAQLHGLRLALSIPKVLPILSDNPFTRGVAKVSSFRPRAVEALSQRFQALLPEQRISLAMPELKLLYQAVQVCAIGMVAEVLDGVGTLEDLMLRGLQAVSGVPEQELEVDPAEVIPIPDPEQARRTRELVCAMLGGFVEFVQSDFADEPELQQARREIEELAELL